MCVTFVSLPSLFNPFSVPYPKYLWLPALGICLPPGKRCLAIYLTFGFCLLPAACVTKVSPPKCIPHSYASSLIVNVFAFVLKWICLHEICVDLLHIICCLVAACLFVWQFSFVARSSSWCAFQIGLRLPDKSMR